MKRVLPILSLAVLATLLLAQAATQQATLRTPAGDKPVSIAHQGTQTLFAADEVITALGGSTGYLFLYVPDVDSAFKRALDAGAKASMPPADMFWGDRFGKVTDPFGHVWGLGTHKEDLSADEIKKRGAAAMAAMGKPQP